MPAGVACVRLADTASAAGPIAQAMLGWPTNKLVTIAVTGTKGKTTFTYLTRAILQSAGYDVGMLGTIGYEFAGQTVPANNTTPGAADLATMMSTMVDAGVSHLVMEVSSHALHQRRTAGLRFAAAAFTNLTGEHLDYHRTMAEYLLAKQILFEGLAPLAVAALNADDPASRRLAAATRRG